MAVLLRPHSCLGDCLLVFVVTTTVIKMFMTGPSYGLGTFADFGMSKDCVFPVLFMAVTYKTMSKFRSLMSSKATSGRVGDRGGVLPMSCKTVVVRDVLTMVTLVTITSFTSNRTTTRKLAARPRVFTKTVTGFLRIVKLPRSLMFALVGLTMSTFTLASLSSITHIKELSFRRFFVSSSASVSGLPLCGGMTAGGCFSAIVALMLTCLLTGIKCTRV